MDTLIPADATVVFVRHAQTAKLADGQTDADRVLTPTGRSQATAAGEQLIQKFGRPGLVLASPLGRVIETTQCMLGADTEIIKVPELVHPATAKDDEVIHEIFGELGYNSLQKYLENDSADTFGRFFGRGASRIAEIIRKNGASTTLVAGHAVFQTGFAHELTMARRDAGLTGYGKDSPKGIRDLPCLQECGSIALTPTGIVVGD